MFEEFVAFANDSDMEDVLTLQTKLYRCAHIFLGKCLAPVTGGKGGEHLGATFIELFGEKWSLKFRRRLTVK